VVLAPLGAAGERLMLLFVRHGQTPTNAEGRLLGRADPPLTPLGERQADAVAAWLGRPAVVVSSPLQRARATAARFGPDVRIDDRWIEINYGELEGTKLGEVPGDFWDRWRADPSLAPPGGESLSAVGARVRSACADLVEEATNRDIVIVSHVSPIKAAVAWALGVDDAVVWRMFLDVASVCRVGVGPRGAVLRSYNERAPDRDG
jgi:broad specificity phosphatase PhoE